MAATKRAAATAANRVKVLAAAKWAFEHLGYDAVTLRDVAAAAGVSTGSIFSQVSDKEELFEAATGRKVPMSRIRDALVGAAHRAEVAPWGPKFAAELLRDLYGADA